MKVEDTLSRAKEGTYVEEKEGEKRLVESTAYADIFEKEGEELLLYECKAAEKDKFSTLMADGDVHLVQVSSGKPVVIMHSKYGAMQGDFSLSASGAAKLAKNVELPLKTVSAKGDGGLILTIEKTRDSTSLIDLVNHAAISLEAAAFLWTVIEGKVKRCNLLVTGNGAERIEVANALSAFIPTSERVAVNSAYLHANHWSSIDLPFEQAVAMAGEMKFDRLVGEMQVKNAKTLNSLQGRLKAILTMSGNTCSQAVQALRETSGKAVNSLDVVIAVHRTNNELKIAEISEVTSGVAKPLFLLEHGSMVKVKLESEFTKQAVYRGIALSTIETELQNKQTTLQNWIKNGIATNKQIRTALKQSFSN